MSKILPYCSCLPTPIMSSPMSSSSSSRTLSIVQLESSPLRHPSSAAVPLPSNYRRTSSDRRRRHRRPTQSTVPPSSPKSPPRPASSVPFLQMESHSESASPSLDGSYEEVVGALLASAPCPQPRPSSKAPIGTLSRVYVLPGLVPPSCVIIFVFSVLLMLTSYLHRQNSVVVEFSVTESDGVSRTRLRSSASIPTLRNAVGDPSPNCAYQYCPFIDFLTNPSSCLQCCFAFGMLLAQTSAPMHPLRPLLLLPARPCLLLLLLSYRLLSFLWSPDLSLPSSYCIPS